MKGSKDLKYTISQTDDLPFEAVHKKERNIDKEKENDRLEARKTFDAASKELGNKINTGIDTGTGKY